MSWTTIRHTRVVNTGAAAPSDFRKIDYTPIDFEDFKNYEDFKDFEDFKDSKDFKGIKDLEDFKGFRKFSGS